jgi:hypothetical protein
MFYGGDGRINLWNWDFPWKYPDFTTAIAEKPMNIR